MTATTSPNAMAEREFVVEHHFRAPAAKVFAAYTDPQLLAQWWAPQGGSLTVEAMDVRPGGAYRFIQHEPGGQPIVFVGKYLEVHPVTRLVYTFGVEGQGNEIRATVDLTESGGTTALKLTNLCASKEVRDMMLQYGAEAGARASWARLVELLARALHAPGA